MLTHDELLNIAVEAIELDLSAHDAAMTACDKDFARGGITEDEIEIAFIDYESKIGQIFAELK